MIALILIKLLTFSQIMQGVHKLSSSTLYIYEFLFYSLKKKNLILFKLTMKNSLV